MLNEKIRFTILGGFPAMGFMGQGRSAPVAG